MSALTWVFELSRAADRPRGRRGFWPGYRGDYGSWWAIAPTEAEARAFVSTTCIQPYDDVILVAGDLISVAAGDEVIWENRGRRGEPLQNGRERSAAAHAALRRRGLA